MNLTTNIITTNGTPTIHNRPEGRSVNPFYAARHGDRATAPRSFVSTPQLSGTQGRTTDPRLAIVAASVERLRSFSQPEYAKLPQAPITASPVPRLTSLYHHAEPGRYGSRSYPGNCGGHLIRDLLLYFKPSKVFDPMSGSGTCADVCRELRVPCVSGDIHRGDDLCDVAQFVGDHRRIEPGSFDFVWIHPPYWRQKLYAGDPRDLSRCPTLEEFLERYALAIANCATALRPGGHLAILIGDYSDRETGFVPLTFHTKRLAFECGLTQPCTDIVRFGHGASSGGRVYRSSFIPGLHDICTVFRKPR